MKYVYKFPLIDGKPKYNVKQVENEIINWRTINGVSYYCTTHRHPELDVLEDVNVENYDVQRLFNEINAGRPKKPMTLPSKQKKNGKKGKK